MECASHCKFCGIPMGIKGFDNERDDCCMNCLRNIMKPTKAMISPIIEDLGIMNSWKKTPFKYLYCVVECKHKPEVRELNDAGTYKECSCPTCLVCWQVDSSG